VVHTAEYYRTRRDVVVGYDADALKAYKEAGDYYDDICNKNILSDLVVYNMWSRAGVLLSKMCILYAMSSRPTDPIITKDAVDWAFKMVNHSRERTLFQAGEHIYENNHEKTVKRATRLIRESEDGKISRRVLQRKMSGVKAREFNDLMDQMISSGIIRADKNGRGQTMVLL